MNLDSLQLSAGFSLMMRTLPLLLIRLGAVLAFWVVALIYLAIAGGVAFLVGQAVEFLGLIIFIVALVGTVPLYRLAYRYVFFMIKAAHIAVVSELLINDQLPAGENQLTWGKNRVQERFGEINVMFVVDELVEGVIKAFTRTVYNFTAWLPGDTLDTLVRLVNRVIQYAMTYIDEAVLARSFWVKDVNVWENARDGVALYAMIWKPLLTNAIALMVISYLPSVVGFIVLAAPIGLIVSFISPPLAGWAIIFTFLLAYLLKVALGDAFAMTVMVAAYHRETANLEPSAEITNRLDGLSDQFQELTKRAQEEANKFTQRQDQPATDDNPPYVEPSDAKG